MSNIARDAAIASLTPRGLELMTAVGKRKFSFFDNGIEANSGIWGEIMAQEFGFKNPLSASGVMGGTKKLDLWETCPDGEDGMTWWSLTQLGADVANALAVAGDFEMVDAAPQMTKTDAYALVKRSREGLRHVDAMIYKGTVREVRMGLEETILAANALLDALDIQGIKGL